ncbi:MAG: oxygen-independent coproporphyrinogen III oxidase [Verrucomicrobia bacterium]|nr:oxygen-independent coproporphyrinogen III oxidase [Verrucomicrobiota bacterium]
MSTLNVDLALVKKYSVPGPRYTSYPPATHFTDQVSFDALRGPIVTNNQTAARDLSLYFHIPFCYMLCWYCGCTTVITTKQEQSGTYLDYLKKELDLMGRYLNPARKVVQIHFGGGSPTFLQPDEFRRLADLIRSRFNVAPDVEASVEIDPRRLTRDHVKAMREFGFNRASLGVQDFDPAVMKAVHRIQPRELVEEVAGWIREAGFISLNLDLIYGLPLQTHDSFAKTLDGVLELNPDRFAVFNYAHVPWIKPHQKIFKDGVLPTAGMKLDLLKMTIEKLTSVGFAYIGMDHFAKETDELAVAQKQKTLQRNFQGYSTHGGADIYAFGMSSISQADGIYWQNQKELEDYYRMLDAGQTPFERGYIMTDDDLIRRQTIMRLMCDLGLDYAAMSQKLGLNFTDYFAKELASLDDLEADGLVQRTSEGLTVTNEGRLLIRNLAMRFDAYLALEKERRYSKTI